MKNSKVPKSGIHHIIANFERTNNLRLEERIYDDYHSYAARIRIKFFESIGFGFSPYVTLEYNQNASQILIELDDFGIFSPHGILPDHFTDLLLHSPDSTAFKEFMNMLLQRIYYYYHKSYAYMRPEYEVGRPDDKFKDLLQSLSGSKTQGLFYLAHLKPDVNQLPALIKKYCGFDLLIKNRSKIFVSMSRHAFVGYARLSNAFIGTQACTTDTHYNFMVDIKSYNQFRLFSEYPNLLRERMHGIIKQCIEFGSTYSVTLKSRSSFDLKWECLPLVGFCFL